MADKVLDRKKQPRIYAQTEKFYEEILSRKSQRRKAQKERGNGCLSPLSFGEAVCQASGGVLLSQ